jgi:serine protease inhibitor
MIDRRGLLWSAAALLNTALLPVAEARTQGSSTPTSAKEIISPGRLQDAQIALARGLVLGLSRQSRVLSNIIVSPASLTGVLAFLELGASNRMRAALHRAIGFAAASPKNAAGDFDGIRRAMAGLTERTISGPLTMANMVVFDPSSQPFQLALLGLAAAGAEVSVEDLQSSEAIAKINDWVKEKTKGLIPEILGEAPGDLGLVAVNALHFKDRWKIPFNPGDTALAEFRTSRTKKLEVEMMHLASGRYLFRQSARFVAVELSYANDNFRLVVVAPKEQIVTPSGFAEAWGWLGGDGFVQQNGELALPKSAISSSSELLNVLDEMGLAKARAQRDALRGFSLIAQSIARIVQKTELKINEEGSEAAAASAAITLRSIELPSDYVKMTVDKPFIFSIRDARTGFVVMSGFVASPGRTS